VGGHVPFVSSASDSAPFVGSRNLEHHSPDDYVFVPSPVFYTGGDCDSAIAFKRAFSTQMAARAEKLSLESRARGLESEQETLIALFN